MGSLSARRCNQIGRVSEFTHKSPKVSKTREFACTHICLQNLLLGPALVCVLGGLGVGDADLAIALPEVGDEHGHEAGEVDEEGHGLGRMFRRGE